MVEGLRSAQATRLDLARAMRALARVGRLRRCGRGNALAAAAMCSNGVTLMGVRYAEILAATWRASPG